MVLGDSYGGRGMSNERGLCARTVIAQFVFVEDTALTLPGAVGDEDLADAYAMALELVIQILPQRLIELLGKAVGMGADDGDVAPLRVRVALGGVLLDVLEEDVVLGGGGGAGVFADVGGFDCVLFDVEKGRHGEICVCER